MSQQQHESSSSTNSNGSGGGSSGSGDLEVDKANLIVNYLPQGMTDNELFSMFVTCGPLLQAKIIRDRKTGYSFGYGFVHYQDPKDAEKAIQTLNGLRIQNKVIKVSYARPNSEIIKDTNLYVANLGSDVTEESVRNMFGTYGKIITLNLLKDPVTGRPKGVAFVRFSRQDEAKDAISALNGTMVNVSLGNDCDKPLLVKIAEEHGKQNGRYFCPHNSWERHQQQQELQQTPHHAYRGARGGGYARGARGSGVNRFNPMNPGGRQQYY